MICCKNVSVGYGKKCVLQNLSFTAADGQITVILGKNGSGKTTLIRAIEGIVNYTGSITVDDVDNRSASEAERAKRVSIMPQLMHSPRITVRELVGFGRQPYTGIMGVLSLEDKRIIEDVIEKTGLNALAEQKMNCISGGERQRAYFAMLLAQNTRNIILDEPSSHMDASYTKDLLEFLRKEKKQGKAVVAVLHDLNNALDVADKIIVLDAGKAIFEGSGEEFGETSLAKDIFHLLKYTCVDSDGISKKTAYL